MIFKSKARRFQEVIDKQDELIAIDKELIESLERSNKKLQTIVKIQEDLCKLQDEHITILESRVNNLKMIIDLENIGRRGES